MKCSLNEHAGALKVRSEGTARRNYNDRTQLYVATLFGRRRCFKRQSGCGRNCRLLLAEM